MKRLVFLLLLPVLLAGFALTNDTGYSQGQGQPEYLALGDSLAAGVGASDPNTTAYVPLVHEHLKDLLDQNQLALLNLGHSGDTSSTLISHGHLDSAVAELEARNGDPNPNNDVQAVTIDIGGNDVFATVPVCAGGLTPECAAFVSATFATFSANFDLILDELRTAAGPDTAIIVMTYYNSLVNPGCPINALVPLGNVVLEGEPLVGLPVGLNDIIRATAAAHDAKVADLVPGGVFPALLGPSHVQPDCLHANDDGYEIIADEFKDAFKDQ